MKRRRYLIADIITIWADEQKPTLTGREFYINGMVVANVPLNLVVKYYSGNLLLEVV